MQKQKIRFYGFVRFTVLGTLLKDLNSTATLSKFRRAQCKQSYIISFVETRAYGLCKYFGEKGGALIKHACTVCERKVFHPFLYSPQMPRSILRPKTRLWSLLLLPLYWTDRGSLASLQDVGAVNGPCWLPRHCLSNISNQW